MTAEQYLKNLSVPTGKVDVILDTDTFNEADDQVALAYMLKSEDKLEVKGICAAPYSGPGKCDTPAEGVVNSYNEIFNILELAGRKDMCDKVYMGSKFYLSDENTPVMSDAATFMADMANNYNQCFIRNTFESQSKRKLRHRLAWRPRIPLPQDRRIQYASGYCGCKSAFQLRSTRCSASLLRCGK